MNSKVKSFDIPLSIYGYGMMALSTATAILFLNGFFQKVGADLMAVWFTVILAAASGALSVALIKTNLPHLKKPMAITYTTLVFIILLGSYLTSFFGYSEAYVLYFMHPFPEKIFSFPEFMSGLAKVWLGVTVTAFACTIAYMIIQILSAPRKGATPHDISADTAGLAE